MATWPNDSGQGEQGVRTRAPWPAWVSLGTASAPCWERTVVAPVSSASLPLLPSLYPQGRLAPAALCFPVTLLSPETCSAPKCPSSLTSDCPKQEWQLSLSAGSCHWMPQDVDPPVINIAWLLILISLCVLVSDSPSVGQGRVAREAGGEDMAKRKQLGCPSSMPLPLLIWGGTQCPPCPGE